MELGLPAKAAGGTAAATAGVVTAGTAIHYASTPGDEEAINSEQTNTTNQENEEKINKLDPFLNGKLRTLSYVDDEYKLKGSEKPNLGIKYGIYLISPTKDQSAWNFNYSLLKQDKPQDKVFINVTSANKPNDSTSLSSTCSSIYSKNENDVFWEEKNDAHNSYQIPLDDVNNSFWKYCSYLKKQPNLLFTQDHSSTTLIWQEFNNSFPSTNNNEILWKIKEAWYEQLSESEKIEKEDFNKYKTKKTETTQNGKFSLRKFCELAVKENKNGSEIKPLTTLFYCSHETNNYTELFENDGIKIKNSN